jgi:hypothetical protein
MKLSLSLAVVCARNSHSLLMKGLLKKEDPFRFSARTSIDLQLQLHATSQYRQAWTEQFQTPSDQAVRCCLLSASDDFESLRRPAIGCPRSPLPAPRSARLSLRFCRSPEQSKSGPEIPRQHWMEDNSGFEWRPVIRVRAMPPINTTHPCSAHAVVPTEIMDVRKGLSMVVAVCVAELFDGPFA